MSLTLDQRFGRLPPPRVTPARVAPQNQTVHVNLNSAPKQPQQLQRNQNQKNQQQLSSGRTVSAPKKQTQKKKGASNATTQSRLNIKTKSAISGNAARAGRREATKERSVAGREKALQQRRQQLAQRPQGVKLAAPVLAAPTLPAAAAPFVLAAAANIPLFNIGAPAPKQQQTQRRGASQKKGNAGNKTNTNKKQTGNNRQAATKRSSNKPANANQAKKATAGGNRQNKANKNKTGGQPTKDSLDQDMDTYMSAAQ